jgi:hypothetical protein
MKQGRTLHQAPAPSKGPQITSALRFQNEVTDVKGYFTCHTPVGGGCIYTPDPEVWGWLSQTNRDEDTGASLGSIDTGSTHASKH